MLAAAALAAGSAQASTKTPPPACAHAANVAFDGKTRQLASDAVLCLVNRERAQRGLHPVLASRVLRRSAAGHSADMAARKYFSHVSPAGETACQRAARAGYAGKPCQVAETLVWGMARFGTPAELVRGLMSSYAHRRIVLSDRYREVGVGLVLAAPVDDAVGDAAMATLAFGRRA